VAKPIVDGLERELAGKADVIRLNVFSSIGRQAAAHFGVRGMPTLIVVDGQGQVMLTQLGLVRPSAVHDQIELLLAQ
jgi:hypothetical protein